MTIKSIRTFFLDPDLSRTPKAKRHCCVCQRAVGDGAIPIILGGECCHEAVHPDDADPQSTVAAWIGRDCANNLKLPAEFHDHARS